MQIAELEKQKLIILGLGKEGQSTYRFLRQRFPKLSLTIADRVPFSNFPKDVQALLSQDHYLTFNLGWNYLDHLNDYNLIIKTPGISPYQPKIQAALKRGIKFTSQTELFLDNTPAKIIGVTGTKGKSTTASLLYHILKSAGIKVSLGGNIGKPVLELLDKAQDWTVVELSSHQLWHIPKSPQIAVFLNIFADHLDYSDFPRYFDAKKNIARFQKQADHFVYNGTFPVLTKFANDLNCQKWVFATVSADYPSCTFLGKDLIFTHDGQHEKVGDVAGVQLLGTAGKQNICAAALVAKIVGVPNTGINRSIKTFTPLPGRLEKIGIFDSLTVYEDYLSTIPEATLNALDVLRGEIRCLFLGGHERNQDYTRVIDEILRQRIPLVILFPANGARIKSQLESLPQVDKPQLFLAANMHEAVSKMFLLTQKPGIVLFSTGAPSFGMFEDYQDRSRQFHYWLTKLSK